MNKTSFSRVSVMAEETITATGSTEYPNCIGLVVLD